MSLTLTRKLTKPKNQPQKLEHRGALSHEVSSWLRIAQILVWWHLLWPTQWRIPKFGGEVLVKRASEPLAVRIQEDGCLEVVTFFISGAGARHVFRSVLPKRSSCWKHLEIRSLDCISEVVSTACNDIMLRHGVSQLKHLVTRTGLFNVNPV